MIQESKDVFDMTGDNATLSSVITRTKIIMENSGRCAKEAISEMFGADDYESLVRIVENELAETHIVLSETRI